MSNVLTLTMTSPDFGGYRWQRCYVPGVVRTPHVPVDPSAYLVYEYDFDLTCLLHNIAVLGGLEWAHRTGVVRALDRRRGWRSNVRGLAAPELP